MVFIFLIVCLATGWAGSAFTRPALKPWYAGLRKPWWTPPNQVFGPVWTILYILIAVAGSRLQGVALALWTVQLVLNFLWSWLFFGLRSPFLGLLDIGLLWATLVALLGLCEGATFWMLVPYLWWITYAASLNLAIYRLNPAGEPAVSENQPG